MMEEWKNGRMERWNNGMLECWNVGRRVKRRMGDWENGSPERAKYTNRGRSEAKATDTQTKKKVKP